MSTAGVSKKTNCISSRQAAVPFPYQFTRLAERRKEKEKVFLAEKRYK